MANLDQICDYLADNVLYYKDYNGIVGTTQANGWYYTDVQLNLPEGAVILGIFAAYAGGQRPLITQTYNTYSTMRVMSTYQNTNYVVRVLYKIEA